jgi:hypothetical protein
MSPTRILQGALSLERRMMVECLEVDVVALHTHAMPRLHLWFQKRYHGEPHFKTQHGGHLTAALHVIGEVCYHRHGDYRPV